MTDHPSRTPSENEHERDGRYLASPPDPPSIPPFDHESGPALSAQTVHQFLAWAAGVPNGEVECIKRRIAAAHDPKLVDALIDELNRRPIKDLGLYLLLLSTIGALRDARTESALISLIWEREHLFEHPEPSTANDREGVCDERSVLNFEAVVQSRAAEMLSYLGTPTARHATLEVASKHPSVAVRLAAIDAHLFNHGDSLKAADELRQIVQPDDVKMVGLPRFSRDMDTPEFDARVAAFYGRYPDQLPGQVESEANGPTSRPWGRRAETKEQR